MSGVLLVVLLAFASPQGGVEVRRIERPIANAQACAVALANLRPVDFRPAGRLIHFEATCVPAPATQLAPAPPPAPPSAAPALRPRAKESDT